MEKIIAIKAREVLDSRGDPTVEVELETENHFRSIASVPSGASVGSHEAIDLRDGDQGRFGGLGVLKAIEGIKNTIAPVLIGQDVCDQKTIDQTLIQLDGTPHKSKLGGNATLAVSIACSKAGASSQNLQLYKHIESLSGQTVTKIPMAMFNFIEGAKHADDNLIIQEFLVIPQSQKFIENYQKASEVFHNLKKVLRSRGLYIAVGQEGGYAINLASDEDALRVISESGDIKIGLDMAGVVPNNLPLETIIGKYPVISLEDPAEEDSFEAWTEITAKYGNDHMIVGDDIFATNVERLKEGIDKKMANAVIVKPNQIGTISEAIDFVNLARANNYKLVVSHRSGETEDSFIADFAVGINADFVKFGAPSRGERVSKYNRLLRIEEEI